MTASTPTAIIEVEVDLNMNSFLPAGYIRRAPAKPIAPVLPNNCRQWRHKRRLLASGTRCWLN